MIIDDNLVLYEGTPTAGAGDAVALTSFLNPSKQDPIPVILKCTQNLAGATSVAVKLQQSDTKTGTYVDVPNSTVTIPTASFKVGNRVGWKYLPNGTTKQWLKLHVTVTGTLTAGKMFCAISGFMDEAYEDGMYINKGEVIG